MKRFEWSWKNTIWDDCILWTLFIIYLLVIFYSGIRFWCLCISTITCSLPPSLFLGKGQVGDKVICTKLSREFDVKDVQVVQKFLMARGEVGLMGDRLEHSKIWAQCWKEAIKRFIICVVAKSNLLYLKDHYNFNVFNRSLWFHCRDKTEIRNTILKIVEVIQHRNGNNECYLDTGNGNEKNSIGKKTSSLLYSNLTQMRVF